MYGKSWACPAIIGGNFPMLNRQFTFVNWRNVCGPIFTFVTLGAIVSPFKLTIVNSLIVPNVDWLACSYRFDWSRPFPLMPSWYMIEVGKTNIFAHRAYVMDESGNKVLTLLWEPLSKILRDDLMLVEFANATLYNGSWLRILEFFDQYKLQFNNVSRLDLCLDFCPDVSQFHVIRGLAEGMFHVKRSRRSSCFFEQHGNSRDVIQCSWGSPDSKIRMKLYDKSRELREVEDKPYIRKCWRDAGIGDLQIWRWEVSLTDMSAMSFQGIKITDKWLQYECNRIVLVSNLYTTKFVILDKEGVEQSFLDMQYMGKCMYKRSESVVVQASSPICKVVSGLMKQYCTLEVACMDAKNDIMLAIQKIVTQNNLTGWFEACWGVSVYSISYAVDGFFEELGYKVYKRPAVGEKRKQIDMKFSEKQIDFINDKSMYTDAT